MGVGLLLVGRVDGANAQDFFERAMKWLDTTRETHAPWCDFAFGGDAAPIANGSAIGLVPFDEPVEMRSRSEGVSPFVFEVTAKTSGGGAGYHIALCELLHAFGDAFSVTWNPDGEDDASSRDETGYFFEDDVAAAVAAMRLQVRAMAEQSLSFASEGMTNIRWNAPLDAPAYQCPGAVLTQLGPRDEAWLQAVLADPEHGDDIFPWATPHDDAKLALGRALYAMWNAIAWREPLTGDEADDLAWVADDLAEAYASDASLPYPWRAWAELIANMGDEDTVDEDLAATVNARAATDTSPPLGYRRYDACVDVGAGWSLTIPGDFVQERDDEERWCAWNHELTVWLSPMRLTKEDGTPVAAEELMSKLGDNTGDDDPSLRRREARLLGRAAFVPTDEKDCVLKLDGRLATEGNVGLMQIFLTTTDARERASTIWHSVKHQADAEGE